MSQKKIIQFRDNCIGCNSCVEYAPGNFEIDPVDGKANLKRSVDDNGVFTVQISKIEIESCKKAVDSCPTGIIKFEG